MERHLAIIGTPNVNKVEVLGALLSNQNALIDASSNSSNARKYVVDHDDLRLTIQDIPGVYSLNPQNALDPLFDVKYDLIINLVDIVNLERSLSLTLQLMELGMPMIIVCTAPSKNYNRGTTFDIKRLSELTMLPAIDLTTIDKKSITELQDAILQHLERRDIPQPIARTYPTSISNAVHDIQAVLWQAALYYSWHAIINWLQGAGLPDTLEPDMKLAVSGIVADTRNSVAQEFDDDIDLVMLSAIYQTSYEITKEVTSRSVDSASEDAEDKLDRFLLYSWRSIPIFLIVMYLTFVASICIGSSMQPFFTSAVWSIFDSIAWIISPLSLSSTIASEFTRTIFGGIALVLSFMPVLLVLYFIMAVMEESGYMSSIAFVIDRFLKVMGLPGNAIIPMIVGLGCNVPGILASKSLERERDRVTIAMMMPFMSCSARLSVYSVFCAAFFPSNGHNVVFALYLIGMIVAIITGLICRPLLPAASTHMLIELPKFRLPNLYDMLKRAWNKTMDFVLGAGKSILCAYVVIALLGFFDTNGKPVEHIKDSIVATLGKSALPMFTPFGIGEDNWPASVSLLTGILAKEVVVGTLDELYRSEYESELQDTPYSLQSAVIKHFHSTAGAIAYLLFVLLYFPCIATFVATGREIGWRWAVLSTAWSLTVGFIIATAFWQTTLLVVG